MDINSDEVDAERYGISDQALVSAEYDITGNGEAYAATDQKLPLMFTNPCVSTNIPPAYDGIRMFYAYERDVKMWRQTTEIELHKQ